MSCSVCTHSRVFFNHKSLSSESVKKFSILKMQNFERKKFPFNFQKIEQKIHEKIVDEFRGQPDGVVRVEPGQCILPECYAEHAEQIYNFEVRSDDVFVCTFPRSGTTWTQEMIWLICNDLDYETALKVPLRDRFSFIE